MWDHVRGNDTRRERAPADGPPGLVRRGHALLRPPPARVAPVARRTRRSSSRPSDGTWRSEAAVAAGRQPPRRPRAERPAPTPTTAQNNGTGDGGARTARASGPFSPPLTARRAPRGRAEGHGRRRERALPNANLVADVYDIDAGRNATLISRGAYLLRGDRQSTLRPLRRRLEDPRRPPHRRAAHGRPTPSGGRTCRPASTVDGARARAITLPFLRCTRTAHDPGRPVGEARELQAPRRPSTSRPTRWTPPTGRTSRCDCDRGAAERTACERRVLTRRPSGRRPAQRGCRRARRAQPPPPRDMTDAEREEALAHWHDLAVAVLTAAGAALGGGREWPTGHPGAP